MSQMKTLCLPIVAMLGVFAATSARAQVIGYLPETSGDNVAVPGTATIGTECVGAAAAHGTCSYDEQGYWTTGTFSTNGSGATATNLGPLQTGAVFLVGDVYCAQGANAMMWHVTGTWGGATFANVSFTATPENGYTAPSGWALTASALASTGTPADGYPEIIFGTASAAADCVAHLSVTADQ